MSCNFAVNAEYSSSTRSRRSRSNFTRSNSFVVALRSSLCSESSSRARSSSPSRLAASCSTAVRASSQMQSSRLEARSQDLLRQNEALLAQLHRTQEDLERNYLEYQALKAASKNPSKPKKQTYFGAGERIKRQLTYRLGATMIQHSRSIGGWISMPWALVRETQRFRAERLAMASTKLPKLSEYSDAKDAERVRRHLSYRLGQVLLDHIRSPIRWPRLPFAIRTEVRAFRTEKAAQ